MAHAPQAFEEGRTFPARSLDFWFDYTCPYAYLGSTQAPSLAARMGVNLTYRPLLLGGVFRANDTPQKLFATLAPAKAEHNMADMQRWAKRFGVTLKMPANHPLRSVEALRATLATGIDPRVVAAFFRAYWVDNADIGDRAVVAKVVAGCGHDPDRILSAIDTPAIKDDLRARTDEAVALGIFGVPAWVVDGTHLYWGQDRIRFVEGCARDEGETRSATGTATRTATAERVLDVYWDFSSPFAYVGAAQVSALARRTGAHVSWHALLLGGLFKSIGTAEVPLATFSAAKQRYILKDVERWAAYAGVPFRFPSRFPAQSLRALRVYLALPEIHRAPYRDAVFRACWADDRDISDDAVLASCITTSAGPGADRESLASDALAKANSDEVKTALRRATELAAQRGVFGVPTFCVGRELFWGQDRLDLVEEALLNPA
jgi:2-hydroxychromene-2-carboxylate isomerase